MKLDKLTKIAVTALEDIKARDILVLDVRKQTSLYDTLIIATAESARQTKALANNVREEVKKAGGHIVGTEGEESGDWVLVDCADFVVHIMQPNVRTYYNLEELWMPPEPVRAPKASPKVDVKTAAKKAATKLPKTTKTAPQVEAPVVVSKPKTAAKKVVTGATKKTALKPPAAKTPVAKAPAVKAPAIKKPAAKKASVKKTAAAAPKPVATKKPAAKKVAAKKAAPAVVRRRLKAD
jgi:ribosome-associated protein